IITHGVPIFDWRALKRWGISENRLPQNSIVRFRELSIWEQYRDYIFAVFAVFAVQALLITGLLFERNRRRLAQKSLDERLRFEELVSALSAKFVGRDPDTFDEQIVESLREIAQFLGFDFSTLSIFTGPAVGRVAFMWQLPGTPPMPSDLTEKDFPWMARQLFAGRDVSFLDPDELPLEAQVDRATVERIQNRSVHCVPLSAGDTAVGVLNVGTFHRVQSIAPELLRRLRLLGEIFANALARKRSDELLRESEERLALAAQSANLGVWSWDLATNAIWTTEKCRAIYGIGGHEKIHFENFLQLLHDDEGQRVRRSIDEALQSGQRFAEEYRIVLSGGSIRWIGAFGQGHYDKFGKPFRMLGVSIDITERKRAEERFVLAVEASPSAIVMSDKEGRIVLANAQTEKLFGYGRQELLGQPVEVLVPERFRSNHAADRLAYAAAPEARPVGAGRDLYARRKDGSEVRVEIGLAPIHSQEGTFVLTSVVDISARKQAEEDLERERAFLRQVIDIDPNFIFAKDRDGRFTLANRAVADAYGTTVENLIGKTDADFNSNAQEVESFHRMDLEVIDTLQERFIPEEHITDARGAVRWLQTVKRPIVEPDGSASQVLGASTDITARKAAEAEVQRTRDQLAHLTRVATLGELVASLAHELNQPLGAILSNADAADMLLKSEPPDLEEIREILADIRNDDRRASDVIRGLRGLTCRQEITRQPLRINDA
ncbi:MAG TPA: PAS domain S-box protein, partial [Candidatus Limnocylindria bacterium]|nr:PAS domain S-box protein [Candidatus Limnocylindria bacterium]